MSRFQNDLHFHLMDSCPNCYVQSSEFFYFIMNTTTVTSKLNFCYFLDIIHNWICKLPRCTGHFPLSSISETNVKRGEIDQSELNTEMDTTGGIRNYQQNLATRWSWVVLWITGINFIFLNNFFKNFKRCLSSDTKNCVCQSRHLYFRTYLAIEINDRTHSSIIKTLSNPNGQIKTICKYQLETFRFSH